jgi:hypothetical protein
MDVHFNGNVNQGKDLLKKYLPKIMEKEIYSENDLFFIKLYFHCYWYEPDQEISFMLIFTKLIEQAAHANTLKSLIINQLLLSASTILVKRKHYDYLINVVQASNLIMERNDDFRKKPIVLMLEGKYLLYVKNSIKKANEKYVEGSLLANYLNNPHVSEKISYEWEKDQENYGLILLD